MVAWKNGYIRVHIYRDWPSKGLTLLQRVNVLIDIAKALDYLHDHKPMPIIHCDLKPSNVLLDNDMTAHVGDFGLARFVVRSDTVPNQSITSTGGIKGSIGYIPPGTKLNTPAHMKLFPSVLHLSSIDY